MGGYYGMTEKKGHVFIVNGVGGSGKGEFVNACVFYGRKSDKFNNIYHRSMADSPKEHAEKLGWDGKKDDKGRELIASIKGAVDAYNPFFFVNEMADKVLGDLSWGDSTFIDSRETRDIDHLKKHLNAKTILVTKKHHKCPNCQSDQNITTEGYDYYIENNGTLEELRDKAREFMEGIV